MKKREIYDRVIDYFLKTMPVVQSELEYENAFQLLVAVILSAQCTDKRINMVTPALFEAYPDADRMSKASEEEIYEFIKSVSYPNNKARHLAGMSRMLVERFGGEVPDDLDLLTSLPGVGRKTANVVLSVVWNRSTFAVDTHIFRVSRRIGLASESCTTPLAVEKELTSNFPDELIPRAHHWLLLHGRYVCTARNPKCSECGLKAFCKRVGLKKDKKLQNILE